MADAARVLEQALALGADERARIAFGDDFRDELVADSGALRPEVGQHARFAHGGYFGTG